MDVKLSKSDSSVNLDSTWFVLNDNDLQEGDSGISKDLLERNVDSDSTNSEICAVDENNLISSELPTPEVNLNDNKATPDSKETPKVQEASASKEATDTKPEEPNQEHNSDEVKTTNAEPKGQDTQLQTATEDIEDFYKLYEEQIILYRPEFKKSLDEIFSLLVGLTLGSFFITICGLSLMFLTHSSLFLNEHTSNSSCTIPTNKYYSVSNNNNTWFNNFYATDEEELINQYCPNKYKQSIHKQCKILKGDHPKEIDRHIKQFLRHFSGFKSILSKHDKCTPIKIKEGKETFVYDLKDELITQFDNYNNLKKKYEDKSAQYNNLKQVCDIKNELHTKCVKLMLKEIIELNNALKTKGKYLEDIVFGPLNLGDTVKMNMSEMNNMVNKRMTDLTTEEEKKLEDDKKIVDADIAKCKNDHDRTKMVLAKRIQTMKHEQEEIVSALKKKQKRLYSLTNEITGKIRTLESKKRILHVFQERLKAMEAKGNKTETNLNGTSSAIINIPLIFNDKKTQKSMTNEMMQELLVTPNENVCICEQEDEDEYVDLDLDFQRRKREFNSLISKKIERLLKKKTLPPKTVKCLAKWDDDNIWLSRRLNDQEHAKVTSMYPKCNPQKGWIKCNRHMY